jgi:hypothetical protein
LRTTPEEIRFSGGFDKLSPNGFLIAMAALYLVITIRGRECTLSARPFLFVSGDLSDAARDSFYNPA